ncbi:MAG: serine hydrolase [Rhodobacteraceae bacterium]|nr:serine hydrolase [Paracoccaceae bacterium]
MLAGRLAGRFALAIWGMAVALLLAGAPLAGAAPYAAVVVDARSGEVLHARNADTRLHPASLTKMMTLYLAFEAVRLGEITMDTQVRISSNAVREPPSKVGLVAGQRIKLRYLVRAAAVRSANDAATAIAEAISGSEQAFADRMNRTAKALGMTRTTFKNAHGLTQSGHISTARDMTILARHLVYTYPQYYNLFSRARTDAGIKMVKNTNWRLLNSYRGADGIKTGYTRAAGHNLVASALRGDTRIIVTMFGGKSSQSRTARVAELLNMGFQRAPAQAAFHAPALPDYQTQPWGERTQHPTAMRTSPRPQPRPWRGAPPATTAETAPMHKEVSPQAIEETLARALQTPPQSDVAEPPAPAPQVFKPMPPRIAALAKIRPRPRPTTPAVVTRQAASGERSWSITIGPYPTSYTAEKMLLATNLALSETGALQGAQPQITSTAQGFHANFTRLTREDAEQACRRLKARQFSCLALHPG